MANPLSYGGSQPNRATAPVAAVNSLAPVTPHQKNTFFMPEQVLQTEKWADINPFMVFNTTLNDDIRFTSNVDQRPQSTFVSPVMSSFRKHRAYIAVPKSVIYQRLWHQIFVDPKKGDDVVFENCRACFFPKRLISALVANLTPSTVADGGTTIIKTLYLLNLIYGSDSLLSYLGLPVAAPRNSQTDESLPRIIFAYLTGLAGSGGYIARENSDYHYT